MDLLEELDTIDTPDISLPAASAPALPKPRVRPEIIMGVIAVLCAVLTVVLLILSWPEITTADDPQSPTLQAPVQKPEWILDPEAADDPEALEYTEPPHSETASENPTVPPEKNPYDRNDFQYNDRNYLLLQNLPSSPGVDVSAWQGEVDWEKVKNAGIEFAFVRIGFRGYESGKLNEDEYGQANLDGAAAAGLKVGAYFFSQALNIKEVDQEIAYILELLDGRKLDLPIVLDWEIPAANARTAQMDQRTLTDLQIHFIQEMKKLGLEPMVYFNWHQSENLYFLNELEDAPFWLAMYQDRMTFPWKVEYWQYTDKGRVPGIDGPVDLNVYMPD